MTQDLKFEYHPLTAVVATVSADALQHLEKMLCSGQKRIEDLGGPVRLVPQPSGEYQITVDGSVVVTTASKEDAVLAMTLVHSVLNRSFSRNIRPICMFVQRVVLAIDDGSKLPASVAKLCHEISTIDHE